MSELKGFPQRIATGLSLFVALSMTTRAAAQDRPVVAVFDIEDRGSGLEHGVLSNLRDFLCAGLTEAGYQIIPRAHILERLHAQKIESYKECFDHKCQIELGKELAAEKSLATQILRIGDKCQLSAVLYDLKKAATEKAATAESDCVEQALVKGVGELAKKLGKASGEQMTAALTKMLPGSLALSTEPPGATVLIDGEQAGKAPLISQLPAGKHRIQISLEGWLDEEREVSVAADEKMKLAINMRRPPMGTLLIKTDPPGAPVAIGPELLGRAPFTHRLLPGRYTISSSDKGFHAAQREVVIESAKNAEILIELSPIAPLNTVGHVTFWTGLGLAAFGGIAAATANSYADDFIEGNLDAAGDSKTWAGLMWGGFGTGSALMATGAILWLLAPDEEPLMALPATGLLPIDGGGAAVTIGGGF